MSWVHTVQGNNSFMSHFHFGMFFSALQNALKVILLLFLSPICLSSQIDNHFLRLCVCILPVSLCIYKHIIYVYYLPLHTNTNIHTSVHLLLKLSRIHYFHCCIQKSIFVVFFFYRWVVFSWMGGSFNQFPIMSSLINTLFPMFVKLSMG